MSRNNALSPAAPRRSTQWTSHLRHFSKSSTDKASVDAPLSVETVSGNSTPKRVNERICTVTINESVIRDEVLLNLDLFGGTIQPGTLMSITPLKPDQDRPQGSQYGSMRQASYHRGFTPATPTDDGLKADGDVSRRYMFVARDMSKELKARHPNIEVYVSKQIAVAFNMKKGTQVALALVDHLSPANEASHVELSFKDMYMSRADMWRLAVADLADRTVYKGQVVYFLGAIKATVSTVFVDGRKVQSAFFGRNTRPIFRSESARYVLFIQMAREMWDFDSDGSGEIMFYKVVNGFLPALFKKWAMLQVKHLVSIVLFARVEYDIGLTTEFANSPLYNDYYTGYQTSGDKRPFKDFYRVVVSEMSSGEWTRILHQLKMEYNVFRRDISLHHREAMGNATDLSDDSSIKGTSASKIKAQSSLAMHGNFLEAINLASSLYAHDYVDRDLLRTGISIVVISPGSGVFEVEYESLRRTTEALVGNGIGIDLICIPNIPLHSVPLFRYRNPHFLEANQRLQSRSARSRESTPKQPAPLASSYTTLGESVSPTKAADLSGRVDPASSALYTDEWAFAVPQWLHISYWTGKSEESLSFQGITLSASSQSPNHCQDDFTIRCRLYDLQMRSVLETNEIETTPLHADPTYSSIISKVENERKLRSGSNGLVRRHRKASETLSEPVYGFLKFIPDKMMKVGDPTLWKQLQKFDESRARLPANRPLPATHSYRELEESPGKQLMEDASLFGTSVGDNRAAGSSTALSSSITSSRKVGLDGSTSRAVSRRNSTTKNSQSKPLPVKLPKFTRQISLGQRGFGIAAPAVATAELRTENVTRAETTGPGSHAPSTPRTTPMTPVKAAARPTSSKAASTGNIVQVSEQSDTVTDLVRATPSRPIQINHPVHILDPGSTLRSGQIPATPIARSARPDDRDLKYSNALREEDQKRLYNSKLRAGGVPELPSKLSPTTAMAPWLVVLNPSNPNVNKVDDSILFSRWQHVFPRPSEMRVMKWKSLSYPAAVPLTTEYFPTQAQFNAEYQRQPYNISQEIDDEYTEQPKSRAEFLRELVSARFSHGFQVVIGPSVAKAFDQKAVRIADVFSIDKTVGDGTSIFMSIGNTIHQLSCVNGTEVEVNIYVRKPTEPLAEMHQSSLYKPAIRTLLDETYHTIDVDIMTPKPERNWNYIDSYLAGHTDEMTENLRFWRARFVLIPMHARTSSVPPVRNEDDEEEVRLEGIKRLAQLWQRHRFLSPSERQFQSAGASKRDPNPLDIIYKTEDSSVVIAAEMETLPLFENYENTNRKGLVSDRERFSKSNFNVAALAEAIQQPVELGGIRMQTRRWHFRIHYHCFIGSDMTTWLLDNFEDLDSREEAVELGNSLMVTEEDRSRDKDKEPSKDAKKDRDRGIFIHVERRHPFRDGQFFYQIVSEFAKPHPLGWFNARRKDMSVPSTPLAENPPKDSPRPNYAAMQKPLSIYEENSPISGSTTPTGKRPKVVLSKMMKYDVDHRKKSYRPERINLHYDRLHNPDNCYHIRIDWMNVTAKLIEDALKAWAAIAAQHGLRLVEVPIAEACRITDVNPFRRPYRIKLALPPPSQRPATYYDPNSFGPQTYPGKYYYQKALLKKFDYVLDVEAASNFPSNVDVNYSWGKPDFQYSQYIHRSGLVMAQITDDGDFLLVANRLYSNRTGIYQPAQARAEAAPNERVSRLINASGHAGYGPLEPTPISSPMFRPVLFASAASRAPVEPSPNSGSKTCIPIANSPLGEPEALKETLETFCSDAKALEAFYKITLERGITGTPMGGATSLGPDAVPDASIPTLVLGGTNISAELGSSVGPRAPAPNLAGSLLFRRGSVQH